MNEPNRLQKFLAQHFLQEHPEEAASHLEKLPVSELVSYLIATPPDLSAKWLRKLNIHVAGQTLASLSEKLAANILEEMPITDAVEILRRVHTETQQVILQNLSNHISKTIHSMLQYSKAKLGGWVDPHLLALPIDMTVAEAIQQIRREGAHGYHYIYLVDREKKILGVINFRILMTSNNKIKLETLCQSTVITLSADMSVTQALIHPAWRQFHDLPVVAEDGRFLGVLRYKTFRYLEETVLPRAESPMEATLDLGELLFQGFSGVFDSFWTAAKTFSSGEKVL